MIKGIDLDTLYLMDSLHHYPFIAEFPALRKQYPDLSETNICFYLGRNVNNTKNVAMLLNFDLTAESDLDKAYKVTPVEGKNTTLLVLTPDTDKKATTKHQLLYGLAITGIRTLKEHISYAYKVGNISPNLVKCYPAMQGYFQMGDVTQAPKCACVLIETVGRKPYLINYTRPLLLKEANTTRPQVVYMDNSKYTGPTLDAYTYLSKAIISSASGTPTAIQTKAGEATARKSVTSTKLGQKKAPVTKAVKNNAAGKKVTSKKAKR